MNGEDSKGCISGGTRITIETAKIMREKGYFDFVTLCSKEGMLICKRCGFDNEFLIWDTTFFPRSSEMLYSFGSLIMPLILLWKNKRRIKEPDIIVWSQSDFLFDVFSAFFVKLINKQAVWLASFYLIAPNPFRGYKFYWSKERRISFPRPRLIIYWITQRLSLAFIKFGADKLLVANDSDRQRLVSLGVDINKMLPIGGGIEEKRIDNTPADKNVNFDAVYMGRMHPQKGILEIVEIWRTVVEKMPHVKLAIISDAKNNYAEQVFKKIKDNRLEDNIKIFWYIDFEKKYAFLKSCKLYITAEMYHDGGLAMLEAMACGLATISFDTPAIKAMLPEGRFEVPLNNLEAFSNAVVTLLQDDSLRKKYSALAKVATKGWDWNDKANQIYHFIMNNIER